jgi:phosphoglycerate dehydrogenase-like enzyme
MKPGAALVNLSRGSTVDWPALGRALAAGRPAACWSDVAETEPLPDGDAAFGLPNLFLTPHNSGNPDGVPGSGQKYNELATAYFCAQLRRYLAGGEVFNVVDQQLGY